MFDMFKFHLYTTCFKSSNFSNTGPLYLNPDQRRQSSACQAASRMQTDLKARVPAKIKTNFWNRLSIYILAVCLLTPMNVIYATENTVEEKDTRVLVGTNNETKEERKENYLAREREHQEAFDNKSKRKIKKTSQPIPKTLLSSGFYKTTHFGAYQKPVSIFAQSIELTDGSVWHIEPADFYKTENWLVSDILVITPNKDWFSSYNYRIINQNTKTSLAVNLFLSPFSSGLNNRYTHWIISIDHDKSVVYLEDFSTWHIDKFDRSVVRNWNVGDMIIIGINESYNSFYTPNILINVNQLNHVECKIDWN